MGNGFMKMPKRILGILLIVASLVQVGMFSISFAYYDDTPQATPQKLRNEAINPPAEPPIGYNEFEGYYFDLKWDPLTIANGAAATYSNFYLQEVAKPYRPAIPNILKERDVPASQTSLRIKGLNSGTIYYLYETAYHTHNVNGTIYTSSESTPSNKVKILTNIQVNAYSVSTNQIKIEWDDVCDLNGKRIDYKLYVSENASFTNTPPIYVGQDQIGQDKPVTVNQSLGKLDYTHTVRDPGRVYYVKVVPDVTDPELKMTSESNTVAVSSFILASTTKVSSNDFGTVWRLDWSPVITGLSGSDIKVSYDIYRGVENSTDLPQYMAAVDDTSFFITIMQGEASTYYLIRASVTRNGADVYPGVQIQSDHIAVKEQDVSAIPPAPELVDDFERSADDVIISYADELKSNTATLLWRAPKKADGSIDTDTVYDIWLISDPNLIDNPPDSMKIESDIQMQNSNNVMDGAELVGYKYVLNKLTENSTYYFKIVAKKIFPEYVNNTLQNVTYTSQPSLKVVITPAGGFIDQPKVPARPPFMVKKSPTDEKDMVTESSVVVQLKNLWYEEFDDTTGTWQYIRTEKLTPGDTPDYDPVADPPDDIHYRMVQYDSGVTMQVGYVKYTEGISYSDLNNIPADKMTGIPVTANDPNEDATLNPDGKKHNVDITVNGLQSNTTYIIWLRAARASASMLSGPSDPVVITTSPTIVTPVEKPTVPEFNYGLASDTYADLGWNFVSGYTYYMKYGKTEDIKAAKGSLAIKPQDLVNTSFYRVTGLDPGTNYYFWIQAEATNTAGVKSQSDWSDSYALKTLPSLPPDTPGGFGIKNADGAITKNSITFEWLQVDGLEYILEVASDIDYKNTTEYKAGKASEYTVTGLRSNFRYYARLYAYDPVKKLRSVPTQSITVRTDRSNDDYDSDQNIEDVASGDFIDKDPDVTNDTWNVKIVGINADRFIEHAKSDGIMDYRIDLTTPPSPAKTINVTISSKVLNALSESKENLIIDTGNTQLVIRPGMLPQKLKSSTSGNLDDFNYQISVTASDDQPQGDVTNMDFKSGITGINIATDDGSSLAPVSTFSKPLKVVIPYTDSTWYKEGVTSAFVYDPVLATWKRAKTSAVFDTDNKKGNLTFETGNPGDTAVAEIGKNFYDDIRGHWGEVPITDVAAAHNMKSVQGRNFKPDSYATVGDAVKFMLDFMDYNYGDDYMTVAAKAGIIGRGDVGSADSYCKRENAISMIVRLYELKTGNAATPSPSDITQYTDMNAVSPGLLPRVKFAIQNGMVLGREEHLLAPQSPIKRAEIMAILQKLMVFTGET